MADEAIYAAAGMALVPYGDDEDPDYFEWHHCHERPNCRGATQPCACAGRPWPSEAVRAAIDAVLALLAEAGRLLPEGGETRQEWGSRPPGGGGVSIEDDEEDARKWCTRRPYRELVRRTVTFWPDGTQLVGAWQPVDIEGERRG